MQQGMQHPVAWKKLDRPVLDAGMARGKFGISVLNGAWQIPYEQ